MPRPYNTRKRGGQYIGKGTYGCGFIPALKCRGETDKRAGLSKMIIDKRAADKEYSISLKIKEKDPQRKYFITANGMCERDPHSKNYSTKTRKNGKVEMCDKFPLGGHSWLIFYEMGGPNLEDNMIPANKYKSFIKSFGNLIMGIHVLHEGNIVHSDIKPDNVVSKLVNGEFFTRFIDFGVSVINTDKLTYPSQDLNAISRHTYNTFHRYYPLDSICMSGFSLDETQLSDWYAFMEKRDGRRNRLRYYLYKSSFWNVDNTPKYTAYMLNQEFAKNKSFYRNPKRCLESIDIYSLGITLSEVYSRITGHYNDINPDTGKQEVVIRSDGISIFVNSLTAENFGGAQDICDWHKSLANFSYNFYEMIYQMTYYYGPARPRAIDVLTSFNEITSGIDSYFTDYTMAYKALQSTAISTVQPTVDTYTQRKVTNYMTRPTPSQVAPSQAAPRPMPSQAAPRPMPSQAAPRPMPSQAAPRPVIRAPLAPIQAPANTSGEPDQKRQRVRTVSAPPSVSNSFRNANSRLLSADVFPEGGPPVPAPVPAPVQAPAPAPAPVQAPRPRRRYVGVRPPTPKAPASGLNMLANVAMADVNALKISKLTAKNPNYEYKSAGQTMMRRPKRTHGVWELVPRSVLGGL
jgi:serine/threonine protein kinase